MIIEKVNIKSHGKLNNTELDFSPSLNIIYGENEAGKSTLQNFILAMLYGPLRPDLKQKKYEDDVVIKKPWNGGEWGGQLVFRLDSGERYEVIRNFDKKTVQIFDEFGNDIANDFGILRNGDSNFAEELLGINKTIFKDTVFISQNMVDSLSDRKNLKNKIQAIVSTGTEEISLKLAIEKLDDALNRIGTPQALRKPLGESIYLLNELEYELEESKEIFKHISEKLEELQSLKERLKELNEEERDLEYSHLFFKQKELKERIEEIERIESTVEKLNSSIRDERIIEIDENDFQEAVKLNTKRGQISERIEELKSKHDEYESEIDKLKKSLPFYAGSVDEIIDELDGLSSTLKAKNASLETVQGSIEELSKSRENLSQELSKISNFALVSEKDVEDVLKAETRKQYYEEWLRAKREKIEINNEKIKMLENYEKSKKRKSAALLLLGLVFSFMPIFGFPVAIIFPGVLLIISSLVYFKLASKVGEIKLLRREVNEIQAEINSQSYKDFSRDLFDKLGVSSKKEFIVKYNQYKEISEKIRSIDEEIEKLLNKSKEIKYEIKSLIDDVLATISKLGIDTSSIGDMAEITEVLGKLDSIVNNTLQNLKLISKKNQLLTTTVSQHNEIKKELEQLYDTLKRVEDELAKILRKYSVESFEDLKEAYNTYIQFSDTLSEIRRLNAKKSGLLGGKKVEDLKHDLEKIEAEFKKFDGENVNLITNEDIETSLKNVRQKIAQLREKIKENEGEITTLEKNYKPVQEIEERIEELKTKVDSLKIGRRALEIAKSVLIEAERDFTRDFVRVLNERISPIAKLITNRYDDVRVDDDLDINVRDPEYMRFAECSQLSRGAIDQIYFILKVAIAEMLTKDYESLPLILDDIFANYDPWRLEKALDFLTELAQKFQVIFFTCHKEQVHSLIELANKKGLNITSKDVGEFKLMVAQS